MAKKRFEGKVGLLALAVTMASFEAQGLNLKPGDSLTIGEGDALDKYTLDNATLTVTAGGETQNITANNGSNLNINGGKVASVGTTAIALSGSHAVIDGATIIAQANPDTPKNIAYGLALSSWSGSVPSLAQVSNSFISGVDRGVNVAGGSELTLVNSRVEGYAGETGVSFISGGVGLVVAGGSAVVRGSEIVGDNHGVVLAPARVGSQLATSNLALDSTSVTGLEGSALLIGRSNVDLDTHVDIRNGSTLTGGNGVAIEVAYGAVGRINIDNSAIVGDVLVDDASKAHLKLDNNASLTGQMTNVTSLQIGEASAWNMRGDSSVGELTLNGGTVDLRNPDNGFGRLTLGELGGEGTFALGTDLSTGEGDFLDVTGTASGHHQLLVQNSGIDPTLGQDAHQVVHAAAGDAQFSLVGGQVDFGTFAYELEQNADGLGGTDWSLVQTEQLSESSRSVIGLFSAAPTVWYGESASLRSRMGELRNGNGQGGGWMRAYGNKYDMSAAGGVAYRQRQQGISFGADGAVPGSSGQWLMGLMGGYSKSDLDLKTGTTGKVDSYYVGAYSTWLAEDGFYIDALIKANRFQNSSDVAMRDGQKAKGDYSNNGLGGSLEVGKHIKLDDGWFVEPFAQASALWVGGEDYHLDNGMHASSNNANSLLGKVGTHVGRTFALDQGGFVQPYVKLAGAREFVDSNRVNINDQRFSNDLSGSRIELGAGVAAQVTEVLQVHADFDHMSGRNIEQPWGMSVGLRYNW
ncbi:autotransporter outer membrane beta-barrel domain-containing protein [Pseudomonas sp. NPDC090202]|uniref:autotransporter outer membrane beta-barrel domain-containing protein n=1 Tax=unclassified Pseudomonas TaxID=196821 RepID=UPI0037FABF2D